MDWNRTVNLPDGTLTGSVSFGHQSVGVNFSFTPRTSSPGSTYDLDTNFLSYHNWGNTQPLSQVSSDVWEEMFKHYEHVCRNVPLSTLTDWQRSLFETRVDRSVATFSEKVKNLSLATQSFALMAGKLSLMNDENYLYKVETHIKNLPEITDIKSAYYYLTPNLTADKENLSIAKKTIHFTVSEDLEEYFAVASLAVSTQNLETLKLKLRDMATVSDFDRILNYCDTAALDFPLRAAKFRCYLLDLTGEDFLKLVGKIPKSASAASAITIADRVLNVKEKVEESVLYTSAQEKYTPVFQHLLNLEKPELFPVAYAHMMQEALRPSTVDVVQAFFLNLGEKDTKGRHNGVLHRLDLLFGEATSSWITPKARAEDIMESLAEVLPAQRVVITIEEVIGEKQPLTAAQWEKFLKEADTYKDLPVSWWKPLVKNVRIRNEQSDK